MPRGPIHATLPRSATARSSAFSRLSVAISRRAAASLRAESASATPSCATRAAEATSSWSTACAAAEPEMGSRYPRTQEVPGRIATRPFPCTSLNVSPRHKALRGRPLRRAYSSNFVRWAAAAPRVTGSVRQRLGEALANGAATRPLARNRGASRPRRRDDRRAPLRARRRCEQQSCRDDPAPTLVHEAQANFGR
jgi:hypothetical protein